MQETIIDPDSIAHYGVKGMKWGVRKEEADRNVADYRQKISDRASSNSNTGIDYSKLSDKDVNLGRNFKRISGSASKKLNDTVYVSKTKEDHDRYTALLAPNHGRSKNKFELEVSTVKEAISPSAKKRFDTFVETLNQPVPNPYNRSLIKGRAYLERDLADKALSDFELGKKRYNDFAQSQGARTPLHNAYFDNLKNKGYNALIDDADSGLVSDMPIILFKDPSGARVDSSKKLSKEEIVDAALRIKYLN